MALGRFARGLWVASGTFFTVLGFLGIFLPLLPATPFLLLAAYCYAKGSPKRYAWLLNNRWLGGYIKRWREEGSMPVKAKVSALLLLALSIGFSAMYVVESLAARAALIAVAVCVGFYIITRPTARM